MRIPVYSDLPPKRRQVVNMIAGGTALAILALVVSGFIGGPDQIKGASNKHLPKPRPLGSVPGEELDSKDSWVGNAGRDMARMRDDLKKTNDESRQQKAEQERVNKEILEQLRQIREGKPIVSSAARGAEPGASAPEDVMSAEDVRRTMSKATANASRQKDGAQGAAAAGAGKVASFPSQPRSTGGRLPAPNDGAAFPPGTPNQRPSTTFGAIPAGTGSPSGFAPQGLVKVAVRGIATDTASTTSGAHRTVGSFLPVGFTKAVILGGLAAPTGGQAQSNPVPVLLRLADSAVLPNQFRAAVRDCFVVGEGYGDQSAERAYIRSTLLSCVLKDGSVLEVPLKGSIFGEDGMNGVRGTLVTKQGAILTNALMSGIAAGIGQGIAQASQTVSTNALGSVATGPTDAGGILRQGVGTGMGKALDRLSQYYIQLAERTFPVIEVQAGRTGDLVVTQGVQLDPALAAGASVAVRARDFDRSALMRAAMEDSDE